MSQVVSCSAVTVVAAGAAELGDLPVDYDSFTRDELMARVLELEGFVRELMHQHEEEHPLHQAWGHDLSHYYWNAQRNTVLLDPERSETVGIDAATLAEPVDTEVVIARVHPDDREAMLASKTSLISGARERAEIEYRMRDGEGRWRWYHDRAIVSRRDSEGTPVIIAGLLFDITHFHELQDELSAANQRLARRAETDGLTGIANHRTLVEHLMRALAVTERGGGSVAVMLFDVDHFKLVNDTHGHLVGDAVLTAVGQILTESVRDGDLVGRYGGEEFLVIMPNSTLEAAAAAADRARQRVAAHEFPSGVRVTISAGVAEANSGPHTELIDRADVRLYAAKRAGRNQVVAADHEFSR